ncbi:MAG: ABC transporter substrate-binding protein [Paracoccaceae bacterium]|nr:ABC transporter substrate-binding protein [Paracoccaceae bacterium]
MRLFLMTALATVLATTATAQNDCARGLTLEDGKLTVATGNPAYYPWVMDDAPESKKGFEAAVAYAVANEMGFGDDQVVWVRSSFDEAIQPGAKNFDFNLQQYSITEERDEIVDFSEPYYAAAMAVLTRQTVIDGGATAEVDALKGLIWGADANTTAVPMLAEVIAPEKDPLLYGDNADVVEAMKANQIDAALFDLPTALYLSAVVLDDGVVLGQFPADRSDSPDEFGLLMEEGNPLKACVDTALNTLKANGTLTAIEAEWLSETTGVPIIE